MRQWLVLLGLALILFACGGDGDEEEEVVKDDARLGLLEEGLEETQSELEKAKSELDKTQAELEQEKEKIAEAEREKTVEVVDDLINVAAGKFEEFDFELPDFEKAVLEGSFSSDGGADDLIEVMLFPELDFFKWKAGDNPVAEWASGRVQKGKAEYEFKESGMYYLVFSNKKALIFRRVVKADFKVAYVEPR